MKTAIRTQSDLDRAGALGRETLYPGRLKILVGSASCGLAAGAKEVEEAAIETVKRLGLDAVVARTGCIGFCQREPLVDLLLPQGPRITYGNVTAKSIRTLLESWAAGSAPSARGALCRWQCEEHVADGSFHEYPAAANGVGQIPEGATLEFYRRQRRVILRNCGTIDPMRLEEGLARGAYRGALRALTQMTPEAVIAEVRESGLRGRGGAGFPTGQKWETARRSPGDRKYVVCNADEGDPGAFMDRSVLEGDPHAVLEGMLIASYAIGAREGYLYVRSEYPLAVSTATHAIREAKACGLLGDDVFGSGHSFRVHVRRGAGAFVCGEETALIASIEGRSGEPRPRPPFPAVSGLWGKPTVINNVKTLASLGPILSRGPAWYAGYGTERNRGTTVFALVGAVRNTGLVEIPLGLTLREMVMEIGGGIPGKRALKGVQTGGPSGGCLPASMLDLPIDYEQLGKAGSMMGSGGMIVLDAGTCMVDLARFFLTFTSDESCGKCTPCREGTAHMLRILTRICEGGGAPEDLEVLERLARTLKSASLCGLGGTAPNPVLTALRYFREEFEAHIHRKQCPAGVCRALIRFRIEETLCSGCGRCIEACPVDAIQGKPKAPHKIDDDSCTRCGACRAVCPTDAVVTV